MPIRIPKPAPPPSPPQAQPRLTREDVQAMLAERDAAWSEKLSGLQRAMMTAIAAAKPEPPPKRKGATITFETDHRGIITSANITPKD